MPVEFSNALPRGEGETYLWIVGYRREERPVAVGRDQGQEQLHGPPCCGTIGGERAAQRGGALSHTVWGGELYALVARAPQGFDGLLNCACGRRRRLEKAV